jgi:Lrp/AsnC family leucine-responsive transcriptional regulator
VRRCAARHDQRFASAHFAGTIGVKEREMDRTDWQILAALEDDGRMSYAALAEQVGLSKTPCWTRVQALEQKGLIQGYRAIVDRRALGLTLTAFVEVRVEFGASERFEEAVRAHPAILECHTTTGQADYLIQIVTRDVESLDSLLREELSRLPGVQRFATTVCMKPIKSAGGITAAAGPVRTR